MCIFCLNAAPHKSTGFFDTSDGVPRGTRLGDLVEEIGDAPADASTMISMEPEDTFEGSLDVSGDVDTIRVWLEFGASYEINLTARDTGALAPLDDPLLTLRTQTGSWLDSDDDSGDGLNAQLFHTATYTGWHHLQVQDYHDAAGDYAITVIQQSYDAWHEDLGDAPDDSSTDYFLAAWTPDENNFWDGAIDYRGDADWVEIYLEAGKTYRFTAEGWGDTPARDLELALFDSDENELNYDDDSYRDQAPQFIYHATDTGTYYLATRHAQDSATGDYFLEYYERGFDLTDSPEDNETTDAPANASTPYSLGFDQVFRGAMDTIGDVDWIAVSLEAGKTYSLRAREDWWFWDHLDDPYLELFDSSGTLLASDDDSGSGPDAALLFTPDSTDTYYMAISSAVEDGTGVGFYAASLREEGTATDPMDALNWGTGTLPTDGSPVQVWFSPSQWFVSPDEETHIRLRDYTEQEVAFFMAALDTISAFTPLTFARTLDPFAADIVVGKSELKGASGVANPPGSGWLPESGIVMDSWDGYWTDNMMRTGSFTHGTVLHEAGHALGLAHPHDTGGESEIMRGVLSSDDTGGEIGFDLNQFPFTIMSYNEYWDGLTVEPEFEDGIGGLGTFGAFDIAALQALYGTSDNKGGNTTYRLDQNDWFETIWDTGGTDTIRAAGMTDAVIDLTAATLDYSATGGGVVSYQQGAFGGFTIAAGVEIERAFGARGDDTLTGNALDNHLRGSNGRDILTGLDGDDLLEGGRGLDTLFGGDGFDTVRGGAGGDLIEGNRSADTLLGNAGNDEIHGGNGGDTLDGGRGHDDLFGGTGNDLLTGGAGIDVFHFADGDGTDTIDAFQDIDLIDLTAYGPSLSFDDLTITATGADSASVTIAGSSTQIDFTDLRTTLDAAHFLFDDLIA